MKTSGYKDYRLKQDDKYYSQEIKFLEVFNKNYLKDVDLIVTGVGKSDFMAQKDLNEDEIKAVLGVLQWLGTPVGEGFLRECGYVRSEEL